MSQEPEYSIPAITGFLHEAAKRAERKIETMQLRIEKQVRLAKKLTGELEDMTRERDMLRRQLSELTEGQTNRHPHKSTFTSIAPFTSIGEAAGNIVNALAVQGFENDEGASRIINGFRPDIETIIDRAATKAVQQERERIKREIEEMFR